MPTKGADPINANPFTAEAGTYEVSVGDCGGTMDLQEP